MNDAEFRRFCEVTGCGRALETATRFFNASKGIINDAICAYFGPSPCLPIIDRPSAPRDNRPTLTLAPSIDSGIDS